jgi:hypothetical protein
MQCRAFKLEPRERAKAAVCIRDFAIPVLVDEAPPSPVEMPVSSEPPRRRKRQRAAKTAAITATAEVIEQMSDAATDDEQAGDSDAYIVSNESVAGHGDSDDHDQDLDGFSDASEHVGRKRSRNASAPLGKTSKELTQREKLLEEIKATSSQVQESRAGQFAVVNLLRSMREADKKARPLSHEQQLELREKELRKIGKKLSDMGCSAPLLNAGSFTASIAKGLEKGVFNAPEMEWVTKEHEESQMFIADEAAGRRECVRGKECETFKLAIKNRLPAFIMQEFLYPKEVAQYREVGVLPPKRGECLLCMRVATMYHYSQLNLHGVDAKVMIAHHWNYCDRPGEYNPDVCFAPPGHRLMGLPEPVVMHDEDFYTFIYDDNDKSNCRVAHVDALNFRKASAE